MFSKKPAAAKHALETRTPWSPAAILDWLLTLSLVDRLLVGFVRRPRALLAVAGLAGLMLTVSSLAPFLSSLAAPQRDTSKARQMSDAVLIRPTASVNTETEQDVITVIASYNQASIASGLLGKVELLAPYLAPEGAAWQAVQTEYARRQARGETSDAALSRWGVLHIEMTDTAARVTTQELWDVVTSVGDQVIASRRGVLVRNTYQLRRSPQAGWLIVTIDTTTLVA